MVTLMLYEAEVGGNNIPNVFWKKFENIQKNFLTKFL